jgi:hypothetical protein
MMSPDLGKAIDAIGDKKIKCQIFSDFNSVAYRATRSLNDIPAGEG